MRKETGTPAAIKIGTTPPVSIHCCVHSFLRTAFSPEEAALHSADDATGDTATGEESTVALASRVATGRKERRADCAENQEEKSDAAVAQAQRKVNHAADKSASRVTTCKSSIHRSMWELICKCMLRDLEVQGRYVYTEGHCAITAAH